MSHFAVFSGTHDSYSLVGIFSTRDLAESAKIEAMKIKSYAEVQPIFIDKYAVQKAVPHWMATINIITGELLKDDATNTRYKFNERVDYEWESETWMNPDVFERAIQNIPYVKSGYVPKEIHVFSRVSQEAARNLALAAWEAFSKRVDVTKLKEQTSGGGWFYSPDQS